MKRIHKFGFLILFALSLAGLNAYAEDIIVLKSGDIIKSVVQEIGQSEIKYKKASNPGGPTYTISKADVLSITYENGDSDRFDSARTTPSEQTQTSGSKKATAAEDNADLLKLYSANDYSFDKKTEDKEAKAVVAFYRLSEASVISTPQICVSFEPCRVYGGNSAEDYSLMELSTKKNLNYANNVGVKVIITNKTDQPVYLDLLSCSNSGDLGDTRVYYDGTQTIEGGSSTVGVGTSLFGVGIGASTTSSSGIVKTSQRVLTIPPFAKVSLPLKVELSDYDNKLYYKYDSFSNIKDPMGPIPQLNGLKSYEKKYFTDSSSPFHINYTLTYSNHENLTDTQSIHFGFYAAQVIGLPKLFSAMSGKYLDVLSKIKGLDGRTLLGSVKLE